MTLSPFRLRLLLACLVFCLPVTLWGQYYTEYTYSLGRPHAGGNFALRLLMLEDSAEYLIHSYPPEEIADFDPELSPNGIGGIPDVVIYGTDTSNVWRYFVLDCFDGHIVHAWVPQQVVPRLVLYDRIDTLYLIGPPPGGGNERLVKLSVDTGTETVIGSFAPGQLASTIPGRLATDHSWGPIRLATVDTAGVSRVLEIDHSTAQVDTVFTTSAYAIRCMSVYNSFPYSEIWVLARPYGQAYHEMHHIYIPAGTDLVTNTFPPSSFQDFYPQTYYVSNSDFGITTVDSLGDEQVKTFFLLSADGNQHRFWIDPGAYDAKVLVPNGTFYVSVQEPAAAALSTYPNPVSATVQLQDVSPGSPYQLWNAAGQLVRSGTWDGQPISVTGLSAGAYLLHVRDDAGVHSARIVKQ